MKVIELVSCRRGGQHAVGNWLTLNACDSQFDWGKGYKFMYFTHCPVSWLNEGNNGLEENTKYLNTHPEMKNTKLLFTNYEDSHSDFSIFGTDNISHGPYNIKSYDNAKVEKILKLILLRDFLNILSSRITTLEKYPQWGHIYSDFDYFIFTWKDNAVNYINGKYFGIKFEDFLNSPQHRQATLINLLGTTERHSPSSSKGTYSSFDQNHSHNERWKQIDWDGKYKDLKDKIMSDDDLRLLIKSLNYNWFE